jgi:hypothetical protein
VQINRPTGFVQHAGQGHAIAAVVAAPAQNPQGLTSGNSAQTPFQTGMCSLIHELNGRQALLLQGGRLNLPDVRAG